MPRRMTKIIKQINVRHDELSSLYIKVYQNKYSTKRIAYEKFDKAAFSNDWKKNRFKNLMVRFKGAFLILIA